MEEHNGTIQTQQQADIAAYLENSRRMNQIVAEMKEVAQLPSEKPSDVNALEKVEFPPEGGVLTYMSGHEQPYKGFPFFEFVDKIDIIKKIQRATLSSFYHSFTKRPKWQLIFLLCVPWLFGDLVKAYVYSFHRMIDRFKLKSDKYCTAMRELHRAMSVGWHDETNGEREMRTMVRDIMCMFLEFDNAYRFRFQDIIVNLKNDAQPAKEIVRLLELMMSREKQQEIRDTWRLVKYFLPWYLRFNKSLSRNIIGIFKELDLQKLELSIEDRHYCEKRKDYKFGFQIWQEKTSTSNMVTPPKQDTNSGNP